jgi:hypothetical protein
VTGLPPPAASSPATALAGFRQPTTGFLPGRNRETISS